MNDAERRQFAMLTMLHSMCQQALTAFHAADNRVDDDLVADLERMVERTRLEIEAIANAASGGATRPGGSAANSPDPPF